MNRDHEHHDQSPFLHDDLHVSAMIPLGFQMNPHKLEALLLEEAK